MVLELDGGIRYQGTHRASWGGTVAELVEDSSTKALQTPRACGMINVVFGHLSRAFWELTGRLPWQGPFRAQPIADQIGTKAGGGIPYVDFPVSLKALTNRTHDTRAKPMISTTPKLLHRHLDHETQHILRVDPITGTVNVRRKMVKPKDAHADYEAWTAKRRSDRSLSQDSRMVAMAMSSESPKEPRAGCATHAKEPSKAKRGRPKITLANPVAPFMHLLATSEPLPWVDDIIHGSTITSAGVSNGKINVKVRAVIGALFLTTITADACVTNGVSPRTAQRIAKAARHAAHGIASFIERRPQLKARLNAEMAAEALSRASQT